ncbi:MAG: type II toxin-antitoxin system RelE/ParE family toxin [Planctomycetaceae bacterium]|nr:type II toxin-antitoxin system RelE/ParE family toxin [Planctomycetaceae bacterium]
MNKRVVSIMARLRLSLESRSDLKSISAYISRDNPSAAKKVARDLRETFCIIATHPLMGEAAPQIGDGTLRVFSCGSYLIYYRIDGQFVVIVRVVHGAREQGRLF